MPALSFSSVFHPQFLTPFKMEAHVKSSFLWEKILTYRIWQRCGSAVACTGSGGTECGRVCKEPFEGGRHSLHYFHHSLASGQTTGREHSPAHQQKIGLKIYRARPRPSEQDPVSPSVSLSHQEASISLLSFSIRRQTE